MKSFYRFGVTLQSEPKGKTKTEHQAFTERALASFYKHVRKPRSSG
jgi:hypothetical protein